MKTENKCWACLEFLYEDNAMKGKFLCVNQRCVRYGLISSVYITPQKPEPVTLPAPTPEQVKEAEKSIPKKVAKPQ